MAVVFQKTKGLTDKPFHYCPGCMHGIIHRLIAEVMEEHPDDGSINIGSRVTIREIGTEDDMDIDIVGASEANSLKGRISNESPVGMALMHRHEGETVQVDTPVGEISYRIIKVEHSVA